MNRNLKFFLIIPTLKQGGAERVISELANYFSKNNVEVHLILLASTQDFYKVNELVKVHRLGFVNNGKIGKFISEIKVYFKLRKLLKKNKPDAVLSFMDKYNVFTLLASIFLNLKIFVSDRSNPNLELSWLLYIFKKITYINASGIVAQTSLSKKVVFDLTKNENIKIIPNPVKKINEFPEIKREKIILNMGRLVPEKGQKYLLEIFSMLNNQDYKLVILGDGPLRKNLEAKIVELGLEGRVSMPGAVHNVDEWLAKASIFALSSISEGFPNVLVEAMAAGVPCVSFDCDAGPRDIIQDGYNGFLVENGDLDKFVDRINILLNDPEKVKKISFNAKKIRQKYTMESIGEEYLNFLTKNKIDNSLN